MPRLPQEEFAAFVGIDWADAKHDVCLQAVGDDKREFSRLEQTRGHRCVGTCPTERFAGHPVAVCLELNKGPSSMPYVNTSSWCCSPSILVPSPSTAKPYSQSCSDPTDAELQPSFCSSIAISFSRSSPRAPRCVRSSNSSNIAAGWSATKCPHQPPHQYAKIISRTPCNGLRIKTPHSSVTSLLNGRP